MRFALALSLALAGALSVPAAVSAQPTISIGDASVLEGDAPTENVVLHFPLTLSGPSPLDVSVRYTTLPGTAAVNSDYVHANDVLVTIPAGETAGFADVMIVEDLNVEPDETFTATLTGPVNAVIGNATATGTILNDEDDLSISIGDASVVEGDPGDAVVLQFPLVLTGLPTKPVTIRYTTSSGTAFANSDYIHVNNALVTIPAGVTNGFAEVQIVEDLSVEPDETLTVTLSNPGNTVVGNATATGTILNDEDNLTVSIGDASVVEGDATVENVVLQFPLTLSDVPTKPVTVRYTTSAGSATPGEDYLHVINALATISAGSTSGVAVVSIVEDVDLEPDETFSATLSNPTNALLDAAVATGTIINDEAPAVPGSGSNGLLVLAGALLATGELAIRLRSRRTRAG